jgi:hypothetical protein
VPQAAATLAAALVGLQIGLFDDAVLNGDDPDDPGDLHRRSVGGGEARPADRAGGGAPPVRAAALAPQRILVPMANPATADALMDLALALREPDSREPIFPLTVVPEQQERAQSSLALAEKMLSHAVAYASAADVPVIPVTRVDHNFANGIAAARRKRAVR